MKNNTVFKYTINDPRFSKWITIDTNKYRTASDLKKQIAADLQISVDNLYIEFLPQEAKIEQISHELIISVLNRCINIEFIFPNGQFFSIPNSYKLEFEEIISSFKANHLYYSNESKKQIQFIVNGKEVPHIQYPLLAVPHSSRVFVKMRCNVVILEYGRNKFIFIENESASNAFHFIKSVYFNCSYVSIQNSISATQIKPADKLQILREYSVRVFYDISFQCIDKPHFKYLLKMDFLSNVSDAKKMLVNKIDNLHLKPDDIIIFDEKKRKIDDNSKLLKNIQNFSQFFYYDLHYRIKNSNQKILNRTNSSESQKSNYNFIKNDLDNRNSPFRNQKKLHNRQNDFDMNPILPKAQSFKKNLIEKEKNPHLRSLEPKSFKIKSSDDNIRRHKKSETAKNYNEKRGIFHNNILFNKSEEKKQIKNVETRKKKYLDRNNKQFLKKRKGKNLDNDDDSDSSDYNIINDKNDDYDTIESNFFFNEDNDDDIQKDDDDFYFDESKDKNDRHIKNKSNAKYKSKEKKQIHDDASIDDKDLSDNEIIDDIIKDEDIDLFLEEEEEENDFDNKNEMNTENVKELQKDSNKHEKNNDSNELLFDNLQINEEEEESSHVSAASLTNQNDFCIEEEEEELE